MYLPTLIFETTSAFDFEKAEDVKIDLNPNFLNKKFLIRNVKFKLTTEKINIKELLLTLKSDLQKKYILTDLVENNCAIHFINGNYRFYYPSEYEFYIGNNYDAKSYFKSTNSMNEYLIKEIIE